MKKIYLCFGSCSKKIVESTYGIIQGSVSTDKILGCLYYTIHEGSNDIIQVLNYEVPLIHKVQPNETALDFISKGYLVSSDIKEGDTIVLKRNNQIRHIVKPLETIESISKQYDIDINEIIRNNNLSSSKLYIGQMLYI